MRKVGSQKKTMQGTLIASSKENGKIKKGLRGYQNDGKRRMKSCFWKEPASRCRRRIFNRAAGAKFTTGKLPLKVSASDPQATATRK